MTNPKMEALAVRIEEVYARLGETIEVDRARMEQEIRNPEQLGYIATTLLSRWWAGNPAATEDDLKLRAEAYVFTVLSRKRYYVTILCGPMDIVTVRIHERSAVERLADLT